MRAATCFSGIGAPEVGMPHWDWLWHAEIEKFPSAVMAAQHSGSDNLGDVTADDFMQRASAYGRLDVLAGGPPCQAFSVAGLRKSMDDDRGNLSLQFVKIAHAIRPRNLLVENVPGWLNTTDNAFGCFLGAILGHDDALHSPRDGKWPRVGMAAGPLGRLCWATLDAQFFGLAQRRKRVFVVVDFGSGADLAATLSARSSFDRGDGSEPIVAVQCANIAPTLNAAFSDKQGLENQHIDGGGACSLPSVALCLNAGAMQRLDQTFETLIPTNRCDFDDAVFGVDCENNEILETQPMGPLMSGSKSGGGRPLPAVAYRTSGNCGAWETGDRTDALTTSTDPNNHVIAFTSKDSGNDAGDNIAPTLRAMNHVHSHAGGGGQIAVAFSENKQANISESDVARALNQGGGKPSQSYPAVRVGLGDVWAVRRLTPTECERLQGFPDGFTDVEYRGKPAADGPRYKALGNSWAVPVGRWILERIERFMP